MIDPSQYKFLPAKPTSQDDYTVTYGPERTAVGTFYWIRGPKPGMKKAIIRDRTGRVAIVPNEMEAILWFIAAARELSDG